MGRKTYWRALDVNATLIVSKAVAGAGVTKQHISKDTKKAPLILPMVALLHPSLTLFPNLYRCYLLPKDCREQDQNILRARLHAKYNRRRTADPRHFPGKNFADVISLPNDEAQTHLIFIFAVSPWMYGAERQSRSDILGGAERLPRRDGKS